MAEPALWFNNGIFGIWYLIFEIPNTIPPKSIWKSI